MQRDLASEMTFVAQHSRGQMLTMALKRALTRPDGRAQHCHVLTVVASDVTPYGRLLVYLLFLLHANVDIRVLGSLPVFATRSRLRLLEQESRLPRVNSLIVSLGLRNGLRHGLRLEVQRKTNRTAYVHRSMSLSIDDSVWLDCRLVGLELIYILAVSCGELDF